MSKHITTTEFARAIGLKPESVRSRVYRSGSYFGVRPLRGPNGRLLWPGDAVERLLSDKGNMGDAA